MTKLDEIQDSIQQMVRRIAAQFHPERIILFGSHARGDARPDSDVDLLVVMPVEGSKRQKATEIDMALSDRTVPLDILVVTPEDSVRREPVMPLVPRTASRRRGLKSTRDGRSSLTSSPSLSNKSPSNGGQVLQSYIGLIGLNSARRRERKPTQWGSVCTVRAGVRRL